MSSCPSEDLSLDGTWMIERSLSCWSNDLFPHDSMRLRVCMRIHDGRLFYHSVNSTNVQAEPSHFRFDIPLDGVPHPFVGSARFDHIRAQMLVDGHLEVIKLQGEIIVTAEIWRRTAGRLLFRWGVSCFGAQGPKAYTEYFTAEKPEQDHA